MSFNRTFAEDKRIRSKQITALIDFAYETGYYAAILERALLTRAERDDYRELQAEAIARRTEAKEALELT